ncbi:hypothetical protein BRC81_10100 [Halobacteriales archaeon QS_1_68_20]|nr:MAG: hypothetical protein BRC81_10100 [Halobacteriales archaeon QS_1_68_20]
MSVLGTVKELLESTNPQERGGTATGSSKGAYWCDDCDRRIPDADHEGTTPPTCPDCGEEMTFERSVDSASCSC